MKREIKFRGKDKFTNRWVFGDLVHNQKVTKIGLEPRITVGGYEVVEDTIGQFSGLKDKNGKEIYEGDIIRIFFNGYFFNYQAKVLNEHLATIEFINIDKDDVLERPIILNQFMSDQIDEDDLKIEVIGNIYDNPELLK